MKKIFGFIAMAIIFVGAVTFTSCEKQIFENNELRSGIDKNKLEIINTDYELNDAHGIIIYIRQQ